MSSAGLARQSFERISRLATGLAVTVLLALSINWLAPSPASALPSFARQTGQPCATCHTMFPELTPYGRRFKLNGYTAGGGGSSFPPVAAMIIPGAAQQASKADPAWGPNPNPPGFKTNDNIITQQISGYYAGQIYGNLGALIQVTGDPGVGGVSLDGSDVRYVQQFQLFGKGASFGIDVNNAPTFQDPWNTLNDWQFPQFAWGYGSFGVPATQYDALQATVAGAGMYLYWNDLVYAELTAYGGLNQNTLEVLGGAPGPTPDKHPGVMPYWRLAVEPHWGDHYLMLGTYGMYSQTVPGGSYGFGNDQYLNVGFDAQYQYDGDQYSVTIKAADTMQWMTLNNSANINNPSASASNLHNTLNYLNINGSFVWDHTYSASIGYFNVTGSQDAGLYSGSSVVNSPNGNGLIFDVSYAPFSHGSPGLYSTYNGRIGLQYTKYLQLYGGNSNFDGQIGVTPGAGGQHNASGNNTVWLYAVLAF
jgi:hypothetical protein